MNPEVDLLRSPVALITAASHGIGAACAEALSKRGYRVALMARSAEVHELAAKLGGMGFTGSVSNDDDLAGFVSATLEKFGRIDAVVVNTGHPPSGNLFDITDEEWKTGFELAFLHIVRLARHLVPKMKQQNGGAFVAISSFGAVEPSAAYPVSSTIRAALGAYAKLFAAQFAKDNIRLNLVLPGFVDTFPVSPEQIDKIPAGRAVKASEIGDIVAFLLSEEASYITGQSILVDGGLVKSVH